MKKNFGFTMVELMVTLAILIVTLAIGIPSFTSMLANNQAIAISNDLVAAFNMARSEAVSRGVPVSVCGNNGLLRCGGNWGSAGWIVFEDSAANVLGGSGIVGAIDAVTDIIRVWDAPEGNPAIKSTTNSNSEAFYIRWHPEGWLYQGSGLNKLVTGNVSAHEYVVSVVLTDCTGKQQRTITVGRSGRTHMALSACP